MFRWHGRGLAGWLATLQHRAVSWIFLSVIPMGSVKTPEIPELRRYWLWRFRCGYGGYLTVYGQEIADYLDPFEVAGRIDG